MINNKKNINQFVEKANNHLFSQRKSHVLLVILSFLVFQSFQLFSQPQGTIEFDSKGKDFWLAFLPNFHNNITSGNDIFQKGDSLYIFVVADEPTSGRIDYKDIYGNEYSEQFQITDPKEIFTFQVSFWDFEVSGFNRSGRMLLRSDFLNQCEVVAVNSFHVTADNEITVYAHSQAETTSEAFMVLPSDVLGREYLILSYNSHTLFANSGSNTPSQFLIVAVEDSTVVDISSKSEFWRHGYNPINVVLNKGEVFLVQANISTANPSEDLTGTEVLSNKPIAVFSGHQRTRIPINNDNLESRDCLIEQLLPVKTWGKNAFIIPYILPNMATTQGDDIWRALFSVDKTDLYINGYYEGRFNKGDYFEQAINGAVAVEATYPILVAEYKKTSKRTGATTRYDSDPFMMLVPPKEQFMNKYNVINTQAYEPDKVDPLGNWTFKKVYNEHYIAIVAHLDDISSTKIDDKTIAKSNFKPIPNSEYYYANIQVSEGAHRVESTGRIGVYIYGYGYANSYGYVGGLSLIEFDFKKPELLSQDSCYKMKGTVYDSSRYDSKLKTVSTDLKKNINTFVEIKRFPNTSDSIGFNAFLLNRYADGKFNITAIDSMGLDTTLILEIPGFTVALDSIGSKDSVVYFKREYRVLKDICEIFNLQNYGKFNHNITDMYFKINKDFKINPSTPFTISSKEELALEICFRYDIDTTIVDTLYIEDACGSRKLLIVELEFIVDKDKPKVQLANDSCNKRFDIVITDNAKSDWGLKEVEVKGILNCKVTNLNQNYLSTSFRVDVLDSFKDAIFSTMAEDSIGNIVTRLDTIQGFTLDFPQFGAKEKILDFGTEKISYVICDTLVLENTGILPFVIDNIFLKQNISYSIPKSTFPIIIEPLGKEEIQICFQPTNIYDDFRDTLVVSFNCLEKDIELQGWGDSLIHYGNADCGVVIKTVSYEIESKYYLNGNLPNPVLNATSFYFEIPESDYTTLEIYDLMGNRKMQLINTWLESGSYVREFDLSDLSQGVYFYIVKTTDNVMRGQFIKM